MGTFRRRILTNAFRLFDLACMAISFGLAALTVSFQVGNVSPAEFLAMRVSVQNLVVFTFLLAVWHGVFASLGLYRSRRLSVRSKELAAILKAASVGALCIFVAGFLFRIRMISPVFLAVFWIVSSLMALSSRLCLRYFLGRVRLRGRNLRAMLIVGTNRRAVAFARKIELRPELGYEVIGFADVDWPGLVQFRETGYPLVCDLNRIASFLRASVVDEVVITLPIGSSYLDASRIAALCEEQGIVVRLLAGLFDLKLARSEAEEFDGDSLITLQTGTWDGWPLVVKRILDFSIALLLLVLLAPVFVFTALLIKLSSPGPVFFVQKRVGLNKRRFEICKFRTMVADAEHKQVELEAQNEASGPVFKIRNDPRLAPVGKFLRKTSIDELPQLWNVLKGEMSLVGPRPLPVRDYEGFDQDWQRRRFSVRPGITCLWQVNGRSSLPFEKWMELDLEYVDKWSLWLDLKILLRTVPAVLKGSGAA